LSCAALVHAGLILEISRSSGRRMGERTGAPDALSVELVDAAQLKSRSTIPLQQESPAADSGQAAQSPPSPPAPPPTPPPAPEARRVTELPIDKLAPELAAPAPPAHKPSEATPKPKTKHHPEHKSALLLDLPDNFAAPPGRSTAAVRPPDITRSGENDEFGRAVIRALRQTMPAPRGELGRVTVRLLLSDSGNLAELEVVRAANDPILTQSIVFAVRQSSFPIPPVGSTRSDRSFLVTYIYN
jgi:outer membrane biosynthesis protein TonB